MNVPALSLRWDLLLFSATAAAFWGHQRYSHRFPRRRRRSLKQVSFQLDALRNDFAVHASIEEMLPSIDFESEAPKIIGLLFAASWCPDCTDVVPAVGRVMETAVGMGNPLGLAIVYVSSDVDEESIRIFKPNLLLHIPHHAVEERSDLKRKYQTCAAKEMTLLDMKERRKHGIPTLFLLNAATGAILTDRGIEDVMSNAASPLKVLDQWKQLLS